MDDHNVHVRAPPTTDGHSKIEVTEASCNACEFQKIHLRQYVHQFCEYSVSAQMEER